MEVKEIISKLKNIETADNASTINEAITFIRRLYEGKDTMTKAYIDCAQRLQESALEKGRLKERLDRIRSDNNSMNPLYFRRNYSNFILKEDRDRIVSACKLIGGAIYDLPGSDIGANSQEKYHPIIITEDIGEIYESIRVVSACFRPNQATRDEMIDFIKENPNVKITHTLFDSSEYIYSKEDGNVYDENGYLFEDWYDDHNGIRMRSGGAWEHGWRRIDD